MDKRKKINLDENDFNGIMDNIDQQEGMKQSNSQEPAKQNNINRTPSLKALLEKIPTNIKFTQMSNTESLKTVTYHG